MLQRSLVSPSQEVWLLEEAARVIGALMLRLSPNTLRLFSLAVDPEHQGCGRGGQLLHQAENRARQRGAERMVLEVEARNVRLVAWYGQHGFNPVRELPDYYGPGCKGLRMQRRLESI